MKLLHLLPYLLAEDVFSLFSSLNRACSNILNGLTGHWFSPPKEADTDWGRSMGVCGWSGKERKSIARRRGTENGRRVIPLTVKNCALLSMGKGRQRGVERRRVTWQQSWASIPFPVHICCGTRVSPISGMTLRKNSMMSVVWENQIWWKRGSGLGKFFPGSQPPFANGFGFLTISIKIYI